MQHGLINALPLVSTQVVHSCPTRNHLARELFLVRLSGYLSGSRPGCGIARLVSKCVRSMILTINTSQGECDGTALHPTGFLKC